MYNYFKVKKKKKSFLTKLKKKKGSLSVFHLPVLQFFSHCGQRDRSDFLLSFPRLFHIPYCPEGWNLHSLMCIKTWPQARPRIPPPGQALHLMLHFYTLLSAEITFLSGMYPGITALGLFSFAFPQTWRPFPGPPSADATWPCKLTEAQNCLLCDSFPHHPPCGIS